MSNEDKEEKKPWDGTYYGTNRDGHYITDKDQQLKSGCVFYTLAILTGLSLSILLGLAYLIA